MFGLSWWSAFDGVLALGSLVITCAGIIGYKRASRVVKNLQRTFEAEKEGAA